MDLQLVICNSVLSFNFCFVLVTNIQCINA